MNVSPRIAGRTPLERLGFLLICGGALAITISGVNHGDDAMRVIVAAVLSLFDSSSWTRERYAWPARAIALGVFLRFVAGPLCRWLFTGNTR